MDSNKVIFITHRFKKYFKKQNHLKFTVIENWGVLQNKVNNNIIDTFVFIVTSAIKLLGSKNNKIIFSDII